MMPAKPPDENFLIQQQVKDRLIDYWWDVDRNDALNALDFYTEDCVYLMCDHRMDGRAAVKGYYDYRASRGHRLVRHVISNLRVQLEGPELASLDGILCVYACDGVPVQPTTPPNMVADIRCEFVRGSDANWRFRLHQLIPLFVGGEKVLVPPASGS